MDMIRFATACRRWRRHAALCLVPIVVAVFGLSGVGANKQVITAPGPKPVGPYSPGILAGDCLYVSGQGGRDAAGTLPGTIEGQARGTLQNVKAIVKAAGLTMEHVVYSQVYLNDMAHYDLDGLEEAGLELSNVVATNVYLDDMNDFPRMNRVYAQYFPDAPPARTTVAQLAPTDRKPPDEDSFPGLEQISLIAVK